LPKLPSPLLFSIIVIRKKLARRLLTHDQEERIGGRPDYRYMRACRHRPVVDRALQKTQIADDHGKKLPKTVFSLK
jgi:hypothetical protein